MHPIVLRLLLVIPRLLCRMYGPTNLEFVTLTTLHDTTAPPPPLPPHRPLLRRRLRLRPLTTTTTVAATTMGRALLPPVTTAPVKAIPEIPPEAVAVTVAAAAAAMGTTTTHAHLLLQDNKQAQLAASPNLSPVRSAQNLSQPGPNSNHIWPSMSTTFPSLAPIPDAIYISSGSTI